MFYIMLTLIAHFFIDDITAGSHEESDWSKQVGGGSVTSDPHNRWPDSVKTSQQSRNSNDVTITSQDTLQSLLARVGLTEHMELFQVHTHVA